MLELETFLDGLLNFGDWIVGGRGPVDRHALLVHHKLNKNEHFDFTKKREDIDRDCFLSNIQVRGVSEIK